MGQQHQLKTYFSFQSQAEAHYKGNRHARRVKGIETSKTRPQESDKPPPGPTSSPSPPGALTANSDTDSSKTGDDYSLHTLHSKVSTACIRVQRSEPKTKILFTDYPSVTDLFRSGSGGSGASPRNTGHNLTVAQMFNSDSMMCNLTEKSFREIVIYTSRIVKDIVFPTVYKRKSHQEAINP